MKLPGISRRSDEQRAQERAELAADAAALRERMAAIDSEQQAENEARHAQQVEQARAELGRVAGRRDLAGLERGPAQEALSRALSRLPALVDLDGQVALGELTEAEAAATRTEVTAAVTDAENDVARVEREFAYLNRRVVEAGQKLARLLPRDEGFEVLVATDPREARTERERQERRRAQIEWAAKQPNFGVGQVSADVQEAGRALYEERRQAAQRRSAANRNQRGTIERVVVVREDRRARDLTGF